MDKLHIEKSDTTFEHFGWTDEKAAEFASRYTAYLKLNKKEGANKLVLLQDFLESNYFKGLGLPLEKPEHWVAVGFVVLTALNHQMGNCGCDKHKEDSEPRVISLSGEKAEKLKKILDELS